VAAAVDAVRRWQFKPGMKDGRPVATQLQVPIVFTPNEN
jgi:TonB family protein